jgi:hypothetical protein
MSYSINDLHRLLAPRRNNYFYGKLMGEHQFQMEQMYSVRYRWLMNRLTLGTGVLCGLLVQADAERRLLLLSSGAAVNALGQEIIVPKTVAIDPWELSDGCGMVRGRLEPPESEYDVYICLSYRECPADYMPTMTVGCDIENQGAPGTIVESFCVIVTNEEPALPTNVLGDDCTIGGAGLFTSENASLNLTDRITQLCNSLIAPCAGPSPQTCVPLARVHLSDGLIADIDCCTYRPMVYSNAMLLELILCLAARVEECCSGSVPPTTAPPTTVTPTTVTPTTVTPTTVTPTTVTPTTVTPTTVTPTTVTPTTVTPTTVTPTTVTPTTVTPTTVTPPPLLVVETASIYGGVNELDSMQTPTYIMSVNRQKNPDAIRIRFIGDYIDMNSVIDQVTFIVEHNVEGVLTGEIKMLARNVVQWKEPQQRDRSLPVGEYTVTLKGNLPNSIMSLNARRLDGEAGANFPTGNKTEGGDFVFYFSVVP